MDTCKSVSTPLAPGTGLRKAIEEDTLVERQKYQSMIGSLQYYVTGSRPDLAFSITYLSQYNSNSQPEHHTAAKHVFRYLQGTKNWTLNYNISKPLALEGFSDSDFTNCPDTRRSYSGYIFKLGGNTICWKARKQNLVASSTTEAEYIALAMACNQYLWLRQALRDLRLPEIPHALFEDNNSAIDLSTNAHIHDRSKHIDIKYHRTQELVDSGEVVLLRVDTNNNLADSCTKALERQKHINFATKIFNFSNEKQD